MEMEDLNQDAKETHEILSGMIERGCKGSKRDGSFSRIICTDRRILRGILKMLGMQRLTKPEYTIYLLWKKNNLLLPQEPEHRQRLY